MNEKHKEREEILKGVKSCIMDAQCLPCCEECPYSADGEMWENNTTTERCNDALKQDVIWFLKNARIVQ